MNFCLTKHNTMLNTYPTEKFVFHGTGREYFKIWIVNLLLTIATLGIYAAWAKVRTRKYFYQSTELNGNRFDFHGNARAILKGNVIVAVLAFAYIITSFVPEELAGFIVPAMACFVPMFMVMSLRFQMANSSYRGLRFHFNGTMKKAYIWLGLTMLASIACATLLGAVVVMASSVISLNKFNAATGIALLVCVVAFVTTVAFVSTMFNGVRRVFAINHSTFGDAALNCKATPADFGRAILKSTLIVAAILSVLTFTAYFIQLIISESTAHIPAALAKSKAAMEDAPSQQEMAESLGVMAKFLAILVIILPAWFVFIAFAAYLKTVIDNVLWNNTTLGNQHEFKSTASPLMAAWIHVSNTVLIMCTFGFFAPFARIRSVRYRIENMAFVPVGSVDSIVRAGEENQRAFGDSMGDALGMDVAL